MEKIKGYIYEPSLEKYQNNMQEGLYMWRKPRIRWGVPGIPVTLSPACPDEGRVGPTQGQGPDYKTIFNEIYTGCALFDIRTAKTYDDTCERLLAKHTPPGAEKSQDARGKE